MSLPRCGSTKVFEMLRNGLNINLGAGIPSSLEISPSRFSTPAAWITRINNILDEQQDSIVKLFSHEVLGYANEIHWHNFDTIYYLRRENMADQLLSSIVASKTGNWHRSKFKEWIPLTAQFEVSDNDIQQFMLTVHADFEVLKFIKSQCHNKVQTINYENLPLEITTPTPMHSTKLALEPTNYNYQKLCLNYDYVTNVIQDALFKLKD